MTNTTTTEMNANNYDGCARSDRDELTIGFYKKTDTLTFTREEWEAFKAFGDELIDCVG